MTQHAVLVCALALLLTACVSTHSVVQGPSPASVGEYLRRHPHATLRVTDSAGRRRWVYEASVSGDSLRGLRTAALPRQPLALPLREVTDIEAEHFSVTRTIGLFLSVAAVLALIAWTMPEVVY